MRRDALHAHQHAFNLAGEHVYAADDQHVVGAPHQPLHANQRASARAPLVVQTADVVRAVANHRHAFLGDGGKHQLALLAIRQHRARHGVDDLRNHVILVHVHAMLFHALKAHARARDFGKPVNVQRVQTQQPLDLAAHFLRPRLGAKAAGLQLQLRTVNAHLFQRFAQIQRVARRAAQMRRAQLQHHHDLALRVAAGHRHRHRADAPRALMRA